MYGGFGKETFVTRIFCDINPMFHDKTLRKQLFLRLLRRVTFYAVKLLGKLIRIKGKSVDAVTDVVRNRMTNSGRRKRQMGVGEIGTVNVPAWYNRGKTGSNTATGADRRAAGTGFADRMNQTKQTAGAQPTLTLHGKNDADEGEIAVGSSVNAQTGVSVAVYKPQDFDAAHPVYHVKVWDADGNLTERMVDIAKVDPTSCDEIEMSAYAWHLSSSGQCPNAFLKFAGVRAYNQTEQKHYTAKSVFEKVNWADIVRDFMQMQYDVGNMKGYLDYKKLMGFLEKDT